MSTEPDDEPYETPEDLWLYRVSYDLYPSEHFPAKSPLAYKDALIIAADFEDVVACINGMLRQKSWGDNPRSLYSFVDIKSVVQLDTITDMSDLAIWQAAKPDFAEWLRGTAGAKSNG